MLKVRRIWRRAVKEYISAAEIFVSTAAVADYRPVTVQQDKIKKKEKRLTLELEKNTDILSMVKIDYPKTFCVGFAAETQDLENHAQAKLKQKNIEMIVANLVGPTAEKTEGTFNSDMNELNIYWQDGDLKLELGSKTKLARQLIALISQRFSSYETKTNNDNNDNNVISLNSN